MKNLGSRDHYTYELVHGTVGTYPQVDACEMRHSIVSFSLVKCVILKLQYIYLAHPYPFMP